MGSVKALGNVTFTMLDDQKTVMHVTPQDSNGNPTSLPSGGKVEYAVDNGAIVTLDPTIDPSTLSCAIIGVKKAAGLPATAVIMASFKNADGTVATGTATGSLTQDPAELDVTSLGVTVDTPTAQ